jgi:hypothetical protein
VALLLPWALELVPQLSSLELVQQLSSIELKPKLSSRELEPQLSSPLQFLVCFAKTRVSEPLRLPPHILGLAFSSLAFPDPMHDGHSCTCSVSGSPSC